MIQFLEIDPALIRPRPGNRDARDISSLKASIADVGLLQPIVVRRLYQVVVTQNSTGRWYAAVPRDGGNGVNLQGGGHTARKDAEAEAEQLREEVRFELVAGERRWRSVRELGWKTIPSVLLDPSDSNELQAKRSVAENYQRKDLEALDEMAVFMNLVKDGLNVEDLAQVAGRSPAYVRARLALSSLSEKARDLLGKGTITIAHAIVLSHAGTGEMQAEWLDQMLKWGYGDAVMSAAEARRRYLTGWRHDAFAWPASFVEPCPACRLPQQPSLFEDEEKPEARCFDQDHLKRTSEAYVQKFTEWANGKGIEVGVPEHNPWQLDHGKKRIVGLTPRPKKGTKRLVAWQERGAITGWLPMTQEEIDAEKKHASASRHHVGSTGERAKPELPELRKRAAEKAAQRHLLSAVSAALEKKKTPPSLLLAHALVKHADSMGRSKILEAAGIAGPAYDAWPGLKAATEKQLQQVIRAAIESALFHGFGGQGMIAVQASAARVLGIDPVATYQAAEEDLKAMPREALVSALSEDLRGDAKHKKGEIVTGAVGAKLDAGVASWVELRELLESPEPALSKDDFHDGDDPEAFDDDGNPIEPLGDDETEQDDEA